MSRRREEILDTAGKLFAQRGFHGVTVADLGTACGMTGPALYKHFLSKEAILAEMLENVSQDLLEGGQALVGVHAEPVAALKALITWHTQFAVTQREVIVVQERDWASLPPESREEVRRLQRAYVSLWAEQLRDAHRGMALAESLARVHAVFGLLNSTPHSAFLDLADMRNVLQRMAEQAFDIVGDRKPDRSGK
jgi:AcrR family transcriptional regulator